MDDEEIEVIHIFSIDGEDYYAPTRIPFRVAMRSLDIAANQGEIAATAYQLRTVLGESAYQALMEFDDIEEDDFKRIRSGKHHRHVVARGKSPIAATHRRVGWVTDCLDEAVTDCLHYFGVDITAMPGHRAIPLVAALPKFWVPIPDTDPPVWRSAVVPVLEAIETGRREHDESQLLSSTDIASWGGGYRRAGR